MKNNECTIYISTRRGSTQTLLSHILPSLAAGNTGRARVKVVKKQMGQFARIALRQ